MGLLIQTYVIICVLLFNEIVVQSRRSGFSRSTKIKIKSSSFSSYTRKSGLSSSKLHFLFPTTTSLANIYIASSMLPHVHLNTYRDLRSYSVCEGHRSAVVNGTPKAYSYFLCPESLANRTHVYCCSDKATHEGYCCQIEKWRTIVSVTIIAVAAFCAACVISRFLIRRCRKCRLPTRSSRRPNSQPTAESDAHTPLNADALTPTPPRSSPQLRLHSLIPDRTRDILDFAKSRLKEKPMDEPAPPPYPGHHSPPPYPSEF
ncbi:hypothetical protein CSKR_108060 [Clonorchis sinensis]|uniref:Uncharacterized protein n=3 Tax=Clonorchis sinensis TaxID=79923 RepID=A0A8T1M6Q2_CLOSI|nr:hypothetical protein CSKR_108060 [Clonorchis sinensis]GAA49504.1 hypothetical protein CLF_103162 [Clonorchis sinensis]